MAGMENTPFPVRWVKGVIFMRKFWLILFALLLCLPMALAEEPVEYRSGDYTYTLDDSGNATLTGWRWWEMEAVPGTVEVPAALDGHPVTTLGYNAFNTSEMDSEVAFRLIIPEGVTDIDGDAFQCCHNATEIYLPATFTAELEGCFHHVEAEILVAEGNPALLAQDGYLIDARTSTLLYAHLAASDTLPPVRRIGDCALINWGWANYPNWEAWPEYGQGLTLTIPEGVESIGGYVIYDSVPIISRLVLPDSLTELAPHAFLGTALTDIEFGTGLTRIPEGCFYGADAGLMKAVTLPESIDFVGYRAFYEDVAVTALNPDCHFETEAEYTERVGAEMLYW